MGEEVGFAPLDLFPYRLSSFPYPPPPLSPTTSSSSTHHMTYATFTSHSIPSARYPSSQSLNTPLSSLSPSPSPPSSSDSLPCLPSSAPVPAVVAVDAKSGKAAASGRRAGRVVSCAFCHTSKVKCSGVFPCARCVKMDRPHLCTEWRSRVKPHSLLRQPPTPSVPRLLSDDDSSTAEEPFKRRRVEFLSLSSSSSDSSTSMSTTTLTLAWDPIAILIHRSPPSQTYVGSLPSSSPPRPFYSRCVVRAMMTALTKGGLHASRSQQILHFFRVHPLLSPEDFETLTHCNSIQERIKEWMGEMEGDDPSPSSLQPHCQSSPHYFRPNDLLRIPLFILPAVRGRRHPVTGQCDGTICDGICPGARSLLERHPTNLTFTASPLTPLDDVPYNNHPILLLKRLPSDYPTVIDRLTRHFSGENVAPSTTTFHLSWEVQVNRAFERLFGYSQAQVRAMYMQHGWMASYMWMGREEWEGAIRRDLICEYGGGGSVGTERGWEAELGCVDKWGRTFQCLVIKTLDVDDADTTCATSCNFIAKRGLCL